MRAFGIRFGLVWYAMLSWFLQLSFDKFEFILIVNSLDLKKQETKMLSGASNISIDSGRPWSIEF